MDFRVDNMQFNNPQKALLAVIAELIKNPAMQAYLRVSDEDAANNINSIIQDAVDRIKIELDSRELGPNPLWTPSKLTKDKGKIILNGPFDQISHMNGIQNHRGKNSVG